MEFRTEIKDEEETSPTPPTLPTAGRKKSTGGKAPRKKIVAEEAEEDEEEYPMTMEIAIANVLDEFYDKEEDNFADELMRKAKERGDEDMSGIYILCIA
jgi:hypothetical protein